MKTATDVVTGKIVDYDERTGTVTIKAHYDDIYTMIKRNYKTCKVQMVDSRELSSNQRRAIYAMLREIADFTGDDDLSTKELMKMEFLAQEAESLGDEIFSLSNVPMSLAAMFQRWLVRFIISNDIPTRFPLYQFADDITDYLYYSLINKKCCVCGRKCDLHHVEHVGIGRDRTEIIHEGMEVLPLCREHHTEIHQTGEQTFLETYHFDRGIILDKTLCRIYGLKARKANGTDKLPSENE